MAGDMDTDDPCGNCPRRSNEVIVAAGVGGVELLETENPRVDDGKR